VKTGAAVSFPNVVKTARDKQEDILQAASGLTLVEAENALSKSVVKFRDFDIGSILDEKRQIIRKSGILEYIQPRYTMDNIGGLDALQMWLANRKNAFSDEAREYGLPVPKGMLLLGIPGVGKSLTCEALGDFYEKPVVRMDFGAIFQSLVGESEQRMRSAIKQVEAIAPCLLWIDEVEKGVGAVQGGASRTDSGVTSRVFATLLTWMSEKESLVYVVCTANNAMALPPEFTRSGRFDEVFFIDLPDEEQRVDVTTKLITKYKRNPEDFDLLAIARSSVNYTPAEIEKAITNGLFVTYAEGKRELTTDDVVTELGKFQPLYNSRRDELEALKAWALGEDGKGGMAVKANAVDKNHKLSITAPRRHLSLDR